MSLPAYPASLGPDKCAPKWATQEGNVLGQKDQSERQHPQTQQGQDAEYAAQHQQGAHGNAEPGGFGLAQPSQRAVQPPWQALLQAVELMV